MFSDSQKENQFSLQESGAEKDFYCVDSADPELLEPLDYITCPPH